MGKINMAFDRAHAGTALDIAREIYARHEAGEEWDEAAATVVADRALVKYQGHVRAGLDRAGIKLEEGETVNVDTIKRIINDKTGLELDSLSPEAVQEAVKAKVTAKVSEMAGVDVSGVTDAESLKEALIAGAKAAVESGRPSGLITAGMIKKIRQAKAFVAADKTSADRRKLMNRIYQKRYRRTHREVWD